MRYPRFHSAHHNNKLYSFLKNKTLRCDEALCCLVEKVLGSRPCTRNHVVPVNHCISTVQRLRSSRRHRASTMSFNVSASASGSDLPRSLPWRMPLRTVVFLGTVITGSAGLTAKNPTVVLLAQQADKRDQNYYANAHPYLEEEPLKKLVKRIPELKGLRPTADQQALPMILEKSGERVDEFFHNVVDLLAHEEIA